MDWQYRTPVIIMDEEIKNPIEGKCKKCGHDVIGVPGKNADHVTHNVKNGRGHTVSAVVVYKCQVDGCNCISAEL